MHMNIPMFYHSDTIVTYVCGADRRSSTMALISSSVVDQSGKETALPPVAAEPVKAIDKTYDVVCQ
jgi:Zn-dependent M16 (insulinase) family peptidase